MDPDRFVEYSRIFRSKKLDTLAKSLLKLKLTAHRLTALSFLTGFLAFYFLFQIHFLYIFFGILHLLIDACDGVVARLTKTTLFGKYFDFVTDQTIALILLLKGIVYLKDYYLLFVILLFFIVNLVYAYSKFTYPVFFFRTFTVIALIFSSILPSSFVFTVIYLIVAIFSTYTIILQFKRFLQSTNKTT